MNRRQGIAATLLSIVGVSCAKVPIFDVAAGFTLADAAWFAEEDTLFIFYQVSAEQGIGDPSIIEITYTTDNERVDWTLLSDLPTVHTHEPIDCGSNARCGSSSLRVALEPRDVNIRLRYHYDGELSLDTDTVYNVVDTGSPHSHRSLIIYGVFDETNQWVQWRAIFTTAVLPKWSSLASTVCGEATVTDATAAGTFTTDALARKNPEVRPAFDVLRSPVGEATAIQFFLAPCDRVISDEHEQMQRQRLQMENVPTYCIDDWQDEAFVGQLTQDLTEAVESVRPEGFDMVLSIALHHDERGFSETIEEALVKIVPEERHRSTPRLAGAFVFDSDARNVTLTELNSTTLWCPSTLPDSFDLGNITASLTCAILADNQDFELGPLSFGGLPILTSREHYLEFIETYSDAQAGKTQTLSFLTPEFATTADHIDVGDYGVVTFLNNEIISAAPEDAFSYCVGDQTSVYMFRSPFMQTEIFETLIEKKCEGLGLPEEVCEAAKEGVLPIELLGDWHSLFLEDTYELGILWQFPFLLHMEYEAVAAGSATLFGLSVPFGATTETESYYGTEMWTSESFELGEILTQCRRFCDHPTFGSAGVYHITDPFRTTYASTCYVPAYPVPGDSGFPRDP